MPPMTSMCMECWGRSSCGHLGHCKSHSSVLTWADLPGLGPHGTKKQLSLCSFTSDHMEFPPFFSASTNACSSTAVMWQDMSEKRVFKWLGTRRGIEVPLSVTIQIPYREREVIAEGHHEVAPGCAQATHLAPHLQNRCWHLAFGVRVALC